jgi:tetratricopeptide (TPR) repeat protein
MRLKLLLFLCGGALLAGSAPGVAAQDDNNDNLAEGRQLSREGRYAEARVRLAAALRNAQRDSDTRSVAMILDCLGVNEEDSGDYRQAETYLNHGLSTIQPYSPYEPALIDLQTHLAELYMAEMRPEDAEPLLRRTLGALRRAASPDWLLVARAEEDLALTGVMQHRYDEPEKLLRHSQGLIEGQLGPANPRLTNSLFAFAALLTAEHRYAEAVAPAERGWQILHSMNLSLAKADLATACTALSTVYFRVGRTGEALSMARQAVDLAEAVVGRNHPCVVRCLSNYAYILKHMGRKDQAKEIQKRADAISKTLPAVVVDGNTVNIAALH